MGDAHESIRNLLGRYCELMDAGDFDGLGGLFADGRMVEEQGHLVAEGRSGVSAFYARGTQLHDGSPRTRHLTANTIIEIDPSGDAATARSSYVVFQGTEGFALQPIITGRYRDPFAFDAERGWHFVERCFFVDQLGDLSHHLTWNLHE